MTPPELRVVQADARHLPLPDNTVDLIATSPPYFGLRSYQDGGEHYAGQIGAEPTPGEYIDALLDVTRECVRVLKPTGSLWINLGDKYASGGRGTYDLDPGRREVAVRRPKDGGRPKTLLGLPWRYALRCIDELGLILRAEVIWAKPNGLPESVRDRVRRSHEQFFHFTLQPRYYSAIDEIREPHAEVSLKRAMPHRANVKAHEDRHEVDMTKACHPLGKLPGSVWTVPTEPLRLPADLDVDHFAAFPTEWPFRIVQGWSPAEVCLACGEGRRPVAERTPMQWRPGPKAGGYEPEGQSRKVMSGTMLAPAETRITGWACACPDTSAPSTPGLVLDPFGGTGTTAHVAHALGRNAVTVDASSDYCRIAAHPEVLAKRAAKVAKKLAARSQVADSPRQDALPIDIEEGPAA